MACVDEKQAAINFAEVFCNLLDKNRDRLAIYLADDAVLDWFGRTINGKDSITGFMNLEVPETVHNLTSIEPSGPFQHRKMSLELMDDNNLTPLKDEKQLDDILSDDDLAKPLVNPEFNMQVNGSKKCGIISNINMNKLSLEESVVNNSKVKSVESWESRFMTPMNCEIPEQYDKTEFEEGQGDCFLKVNVSSSSKANRFLEARGSIQFQRTKQPRMPKNMKLMSDTMKWCRFCKLQIAYSNPSTGFQNLERGDGLTSDFKIWLLVYQDNTRCRRNLADAFDQVK